MSVEKAARELISSEQIPESLLDKIETTFRAYDPCLGCGSLRDSGCDSEPVPG